MGPMLAPWTLLSGIICDGRGGPTTITVSATVIFVFLPLKVLPGPQLYVIVVATSMIYEPIKWHIHASYKKTHVKCNTNSIMVAFAPLMEINLWPTVFPSLDYIYMSIDKGVAVLLYSNHWTRYKLKFLVIWQTVVLFFKLIPILLQIVYKTQYYPCID